MIRVACIIPARFASTRFPGKPLAEILGKSMLQWVWEGAIQSRHATEVLIATDDKRIHTASAGFGAKCLMTGTQHDNGTDRIAEVALINDAEIFVNVQGDEPLITGQVIDDLIAPMLKDPSIQAASTYRKAGSDDDMLDPNTVKVVCDSKSNALYFSRYPIPYDRDTKRSVVRNIHVGMYAYRRDFLLDLAQMKPTVLEQTERLEQLRILENGYKIHMVETNFQSVAVDRPGDIAKVEAALQAAGKA